MKPNWKELILKLHFRAITDLFLLLIQPKYLDNLSHNLIFDIFNTMPVLCQSLFRKTSLAISSKILILSFFNENSLNILCQEKTARHAIEQFITNIYRKPNLAHINDKNTRKKSSTHDAIDFRTGNGFGFCQHHVTMQRCSKRLISCIVNIRMLLFHD